MLGNDFIDVLTLVCDALDSVGIRYAVTGSVASSVHGEPITSFDVDICLTMTAADARRFDEVLPDRFYRNLEGMEQAATNRSMSNIIDTKTGLKVDLSTLPDEPYFRSVMVRRYQIAYEPGGRSFWTVTAEDIVLMKLLWRKDSRSQKQWDNALSVVRVRANQLDVRYLREWADRLGIQGDLDALINEAGL